MPERTQHWISTLLLALLYLGPMMASCKDNEDSQKVFLNEVSKYSANLESLNRSNGNHTLQSLFEQGQQIGQLAQSTFSSRDTTILESLDEKTFQQVEKRMTGFIVNREEGAFIVPNTAFFKKLAVRKGLRADRAFFEIYDASFHDSMALWRVYMTQLTDYSGCEKYGSFLFVKLYRPWKTFQKEFPSAYASSVKTEIGAIEDTLTGGTCACGDSTSVLSEFRAFVKAFSESRTSKILKKRIEEIKNGSSKMRFNCP